jgi:DNA-binding PadR family transcriptional regulator
MKGSHIGELEELILLTVGILHNEAYGVSVLQEIKVQTDRDVNISAVHAVMNRLEEKGLLDSSIGGATSVRGGRRKKYYTLSAGGRSIVEALKNQRDKLYNQLPPLSYNFA